MNDAGIYADSNSGASQKFDWRPLKSAVLSFRIAAWPLLAKRRESNSPGVQMLKGLRIVILSFLAISTSVQASAVAGHDFAVLDTPQRQEVKGKIEVIEFFSWGCPHCYEFYPLWTHWLSQLPKDTTFRRVPVGFGHPEWDNLVRAYYALQSTGDVDRLDSAIFEAIHREHLSLFDEKSITAWVGNHGVNIANFTAAFHSFGVDHSVDQSEQAVVAYRVDSVPTIAIGGRYTVTGEHAKMLEVSDELIAKARAEDKKPKK